VGSMPSYDWSNPGFDFIYRSWNVVATPSGAAFTLDVSGGLEHPLFVIHELDFGQVIVELDGVPLAADVDFVTSYDAEGRRLWLSLQQQLAAGQHEFLVRRTDEEDASLTTASTTSGATSTTTGGTTMGAGGEMTTGAGSDTTTGSGGSTASGTDDTATASTTAGGGGEDDSGCGCRVGPHADRGAGRFAVWVLAWGAILGRLRRRVPSRC